MTRSTSTKKDIEYISEDKCYVFECPNCELMIQVNQNEINCSIFRHGVMKNSGIQVDPHLSKEHCDKLIEQNMVNGCCKPFRIYKDQNGKISYVDICDYI